MFLAKLYPNNNSIKVTIAQSPIANAQRTDIMIIIPIAVLSSVITYPNYKTNYRHFEKHAPSQAISNKILPIINPAPNIILK